MMSNSEEEGIDDARMRRDGDERLWICGKDLIEKQAYAYGLLGKCLLIRRVPQYIVFCEARLKVVVWVSLSKTGFRRTQVARM